MVDEKSAQRVARRVAQLNKIAQEKGFATWTRLETAVIGGAKIEVDQFPNFANALKAKLYDRHCTAREFAYAFCQEYYKWAVASTWTTGDYTDFEEWCKEHKIDEGFAGDLIDRMGEPDMTLDLDKIGNLDVDHLGFSLTVYLFSDSVIATDTERGAFYFRPETPNFPSVKNFTDAVPDSKE